MIVSKSFPLFKLSVVEDERGDTKHAVCEDLSPLTMTHSRILLSLPMTGPLTEEGRTSLDGVEDESDMEYESLDSFIPGGIY